MMRQMAVLAACLATTPAAAQTFCTGLPQPVRGLVLEITRIIVAHGVPDPANTHLAEVRFTCLDPDGVRTAVCGVAAHSSATGYTDRAVRFSTVVDQGEHHPPPVLLTGKSAEAECRKLGMP